MGQLIDAMLEGGLDPLLKIVTKDSKITLFFFLSISILLRRFIYQLLS